MRIGNWVLAASLAAAFTAAGCATSVVKGPPLNVALTDLNHSFTKYGYVNTEDLLSQKVSGEAVQAVRNRQCGGANGEPRADPLLFSPSAGVLTLKGTFSENGGFSVSGAQPVPTINLGATSTGENSITFNYQLMTLSNLPAYNLESMVANSQADLKIVAGLATLAKAGESANAAGAKSGAAPRKQKSPAVPTREELEMRKAVMARITKDLDEIEAAGKDQIAVAQDVNYLESNFWEYYDSGCCGQKKKQDDACANFNRIPNRERASLPGQGGPVLLK